jgi:hypothetical protein
MRSTAVTSRSLIVRELIRPFNSFQYRTLRNPDAASASSTR